MILIKENEIDLQTSNACMLNIFNQFIVTNNDFGLCLYDKDLSLIKKITWPEDVGVYMSYQHFSENKLLLDCSEDGFLLYVNLDNGQMETIPFNFPETIYLGYLYDWNNDNVIFKSSKTYVKVDLKQKKVLFLSDEDVAKENPTFYAFCMKTKEYPSASDMPGPFQFIYVSSDKNRVGCYNFLTDETVEVKAPEVIDHAVSYIDGCFAFVNARKVRVSNQNGDISILEADSNQEFLVVQLYDKANRLIILSARYTESGIDEYLTTYRIEQ